MTTADLPALNATLNATVTLLLVAGFAFVRRNNVPAHKMCMIAAFGVSCVFLASYVTYHAIHGSTKFTQTGPIRHVYFTILVTHVILAAAIVPMVLITLVRGLRGHIHKHRRLARWTWPLWLYVAVTGVVVYLMLYQWYAPA